MVAITYGLRRTPIRLVTIHAILNPINAGCDHKNGLRVLLRSETVNVCVTLSSLYVAMCVK